MLYSHFVDDFYPTDIPQWCPDECSFNCELCTGFKHILVYYSHQWSITVYIYISHIHVIYMLYTCYIHVIYMLYTCYIHCNSHQWSFTCWLVPYRMWELSLRAQLLDLRHARGVVRGAASGAAPALLAVMEALRLVAAGERNRSEVSVLTGWHIYIYAHTHTHADVNHTHTCISISISISISIFICIYIHINE